jgi:DNA invertase Pin-like site-specific DNA recombinase
MNKPATLKRAAILARVSSDSQAGEDKTSLPEQVRICSEAAQADGYEVLPQHIESNSISGRFKITDRHDLQRLLELHRSGVVQRVYVKRMDRLARNRLASGIFREELGPDLVVVDMRLDDSDEGEWMGGQLEGFAEYEKNVITKRTYEGRVKKQQSGERPWNGSPPYWCERVWDDDGKRKKITLVPARVAVARRMFAMSAAGHGAGAIARALNLDGVPSSNRGEWTSRSVLLILHSTAAYGDWMCYASPPQGVAAKLVRRGLSRQVAVHKIEAIIDRALFDKVQAAIDERTRTRGPNNNWLLSRLLRCEVCGNFMYVKWNNSKYARRVYACGKLEGDHVVRCTNPYRRIPADEVEAQLTTSLSELMSKPAAIEEAVRIFLGDLDKRITSLQSRSGGEQERAKLDSKLKRLRRAYVDDDDPDEAEYDKQVAQVKDRLARLCADETSIGELRNLAAQRSGIEKLLRAGSLRVATTRAGRAGVLDDDMNVLLRGSTADLLKALDLKLLLRTSGKIEVTGRLPFNLFADERVKTPTRRNGHTPEQAQTKASCR